MRIPIVVGSILLLASCDNHIAPSPPARGHDVAAVTVTGGAFTFDRDFRDSGFGVFP